jgi:threonine/homoserine/homoserine lactone efflux protein
MSSAEVELGLTAVAAMLSPTTLTFSVLVLVLSERPKRSGLWFFAGAFVMTMAVGLLAAFVLGNAATPSNSSSSTPKTWVAILDIVLGALLLVLVVRTLRRPRDPKRVADAVDKMSKLSSSPAVAILGAGASLANPGAFIPIALKDISQLNPSAGQYILLWTAFAIVALLPLLAAMIGLVVSPDRANRTLQAMRRWLERNARIVAAVIVVLLAAALLRNGIVGLS